MWMQVISAAFLILSVILVFFYPIMAIVPIAAVILWVASPRVWFPPTALPQEQQPHGTQLRQPATRPLGGVVEPPTAAAPPPPPPPASAADDGPAVESTAGRFYADAAQQDAVDDEWYLQPIELELATHSANVSMMHTQGDGGQTLGGGKAQQLQEAIERQQQYAADQMPDDAYTHTVGKKAAKRPRVLKPHKVDRSTFVTQSVQPTTLREMEPMPEDDDDSEDDE